jgi:hypothetical protein
LKGTTNANLSKRNNAYENVRNYQTINYNNGSLEQQSLILKGNVHLLYANNIKSLTQLCIHLNYCKIDLNQKTRITLIQLQIEVVTPLEWALGPHKHCY